MRASGSTKSATAFRTISEVSTELDVPQHVLRFWEGKFPQIRPLKRGGGRRYYRPEDVELLRRIQSLLYKEGYTIKGVQRLLKEGRAPVEEVVEDDSDEDFRIIREPEPEPVPDLGGETPADSPAIDPEENHVAAEDADPAAPPANLHAGLSDTVRHEIVQVLDELKALHAMLNAGHTKKDSFIA